MFVSSSAYHDILLQQVFPAIGVCTGTFMCFAPFRAVLQASRDGHLGELNPTPWVFMLGNSVGWLAYAFLIENVYVFLPNAPGFVLAIWLNIQAIKLQYENYRSNELQNAIIAALEEQRESKKKLKVEEVEEIVEMVVAGEDMAIDADILLPMSTAPVSVVADDEEHGGASGTMTRSRSNTFDAAYFQPRTSPARTSSFHTYSSTATTASNRSAASQYQLDIHRGRQEDVPPGNDVNGNDNNNGNGNGNNNERDDGAATVFEDAADAIVDYASFIWDIAIQKTPAPASHEIMVVTISALWLVLITIAGLGRPLLDENFRTKLIGYTVNLNLIFFYGAPLSKIATVLETKTSASIHVGTMAGSLLNGTLWFCYGVAVGDYFISVPNGFGALLGIIQMVLCLIYPRHRHHRRSKESDYDSMVSQTSSEDSVYLPVESAPLI